MTECVNFANAVLQKVYGGMACQPSHSRNLPFTGFELTMWLLIGSVLIVSGYYLRKDTKGND